ncbi:MAG: PQQ-dependent sugar dehydrogenase [Acidobacteriota bacterium]|nr:PQQ-dependent sugar dehydrogenase [Acidobacteriota bacterium]
MKLSSAVGVPTIRLATNRRSTLVIVATLLLLCWPIAASAATLPAGFTETIITGLSSPTAMTFAPDGRLFVCQQTGALRVIKNGALLAAPFITLSVNSSGERGLLGVAFDPNFASNNFIYLYYTVPTAPIHNRVSRFTANGDVVVPGSELIILEPADRRELQIFSER